MEPKLIAGEDQLLEWAREVWSIDDPIICIWQTDNDPTQLELGSNKFLAVDLVRFYIKEQIDSLFFPFGFKRGAYNLVLAGIKEDNPDIIHVPMNGLLRGWLLGNDMDELIVDVDIDLNF